jgi:hypothetical protein
VQQLSGYATFAFTEGLLQTYLLQMLRVQCLPQFMAIHTLLTGDHLHNPIRICSVAPTPEVKYAIKVQPMETDVEEKKESEGGGGGGGELQQEAAAWQKELAEYASWAPDIFAPISPAESEPTSIGGLSRLANLCNVLSGRALMILGSGRRDSAQLLCYLDAWKSTYRRMEREKSQIEKTAREAHTPTAMEMCMEEEKGGEATAVAASASSSSATSSSAAPAAPTSLSARMWDTYNSPNSSRLAGESALGFGTSPMLTAFLEARVWRRRSRPCRTH